MVQPNHGYTPWRLNPEVVVTDVLTNTQEQLQDPPLHFRAHVFVCCNRRPEGHRRGSCAARGSDALRDYMKVRAKELGLTNIRINQAGCLDRCEFGPAVVIYPEGVWYSPRTQADVDTILEVHLLSGGRAKALMLTERDLPPPKR